MQYLVLEKYIYSCKKLEHNSYIDCLPHPPLSLLPPADVPDSHHSYSCDTQAEECILHIVGVDSFILHLHELDRIKMI